ARLRSFGIPLGRVLESIRASNREVGGRVVEMAEAEFMVRGRGYVKSIADLEQIVVKADGPTPVLLRDVARIELGPDERRGVTELNGAGEVVGGAWGCSGWGRMGSTSSTTPRPRSRRSPPACPRACASRRSTTGRS